MITRRTFLFRLPFVPGALKALFGAPEQDNFPFIFPCEFASEPSRLYKFFLQLVRG